jgi:hypothetical protein
MPLSLVPQVHDFFCAVVRSGMSALCACFKDSLTTGKRF